MSWGCQVQSTFYLVQVLITFQHIILGNYVGNCCQAVSTQVCSRYITKQNIIKSYQIKLIVKCKTICEFLGTGINVVYGVNAEYLAFSWHK